MSMYSALSKLDMKGLAGIEQAIARAIWWWETDMAVRFPGKASLHKVIEEMAELEADPDCAEEAADVIIALAVYCYRNGTLLSQAIQRKMEINENRVWGEMNEDGVVRHISGT